MAVLHPDITLILPDAEATAALGERLAELLQAAHFVVGEGRGHGLAATIAAIPRLPSCLRFRMAKP